MPQLLGEQGYDRAKVKVSPGTPYHEILNEAKAQKIDLIVIGSHGRSGITRFLLGSTSERLVRHAECPVLVFRLSEGEQEAEHARRPGKIKRTHVT